MAAAKSESYCLCTASVIFSLTSLVPRHSSIPVVPALPDHCSYDVWFKKNCCCNYKFTTACSHTGKNQWMWNRPPNLTPPPLITRPHMSPNRNGSRRCVEWRRSWEGRRRWPCTRSSSSETTTQTCRSSRTPRSVHYMIMMLLYMYVYSLIPRLRFYTWCKIKAGEWSLETRLMIAN